MIRFRQFLTENYSYNDGRFIGYGNTHLDHLEYFGMKSHPFTDILKESSEGDGEFLRMSDIKKGFRNAFSDADSPQSRADNVKVSRAAWNKFKREYENAENIRRVNENEDIDRVNNHIEAAKLASKGVDSPFVRNNLMSDADISNMLGSKEASRAHNILARAHTQGHIKLSDAQIHSILDNHNASDAHLILESAHVTRSPNQPQILNYDHVQKLREFSPDGELSKHSVNKNFFAKRKMLSLGNSNAMLSSNGKYDPEHHESDSNKKGVKILGLALAPHEVAGGMDVCPKSTVGCRRACLALRAGMNQGEERNYHIKIARTRFMQQHPENFMRIISDEIDRHHRSSVKAGYEPALRLNANSDLAIEKFYPSEFWQRHGRDGQGNRFYDYTKIAERADSEEKREKLRKLGYHLTLSHSGTDHAESNDHEVARNLDNGGNAAMVFRTREKSELPHVVVIHRRDGTATAHPVHDANERDDRYNDEVHYPHSPEFARFLAQNANIKPGNGMVSGLTGKGNTEREIAGGVFFNPISQEGDFRVAHIREDSADRNLGEPKDWKRREIPLRFEPLRARKVVQPS